MEVTPIIHGLPHACPELGLVIRLDVVIQESLVDRFIEEIRNILINDDAAFAVGHSDGRPVDILKALLAEQCIGQ